MTSLRTITLGDIAREHRRSRHDLVAVVDGGTRLTYRQLDERSNRIAASLRQRGLGRGDCLMWFGQNSFRLLELIVAAAKIGAFVVPLNWRERPTVLAAAITEAEPGLVMWQQEEIGDLVAHTRALVTTPAFWLRHDGAEYEQFLAGGSADDEEAPVDADSPILGIYTAGTGGAASAALLSHLAVFVESLAIGRVGELSDETVFLNSGPLFHLGTLVSTLATFLHGGTNVFVRRVDPVELCRVVEAERCNRAFLTAPTVAAMRQACSGADFDLSSLWPGHDPAGWTSLTPSLNPSSGRGGAYGQSEVTGLATFAGLGRLPLSPYGRPYPTVQVRVVTSEGWECGPGEIGEIVFRGPTVTVGFLRRPDLTAARQRNGWHHSGDLGLREADGSIRFVAPMGRLIKSASENIHPVEVERCLVEHPAIRDVCVIGVPDPHWTQVVKALVVLEPGATLDIAELGGFAGGHLASYKKPRLMQVVESIPRHPDGQIDRGAADRLGGGGGYPGERSGSAGPVPHGPIPAAVAPAGPTAGAEAGTGAQR